MSILGFTILVAILALSFAAINFFSVKRLDEGTDKMKEVAAAIRVGANAFINYEYRVIYSIVAIVVVILTVFVSLETAAAFFIGTIMSGSAGFIGMKIATYANVRVSNKARETGKLGETLKVAFKGGSVMGLCVAGFALLGLCIVYILFGKVLGQLNDLTNIKNWLGIEFIPFTMTLSGYALGCSIIAMFNRVGGGIYTKAADMGADLVGKTEVNIPEDDPRNPATIADNVGDNVGDVAGLGSDLLESYVGAIVSATILAFHLFLTSKAVGSNMSNVLLEKLFLYPILFASMGLVACIVGILFLLVKKISDNPRKELNTSTWTSAGITVLLGFFLSKYMFSGLENNIAGFNFGYMSPWISATCGIIGGIIIGVIAEYYTSDDYKPTQKIANACKEGPALTITQGMSVGMMSCMAPLFVLGLAIGVSYFVAGMYGVAMAAVGMLSFVTATVTVDTYGPISDNAGGISEMSKLDPEVRSITDKLDSVGNTTAAIGKGFAIGSAALAALSLMVSYLYSYMPVGSDLVLNIINPLTLIGALIGAALPFYFSGLLIDAVANAARKMVDEVRRQFKEKPGIMTGEEKPDYKTCIEISSQGALKEMKFPAFIAIFFPLISGFLFGAHFVGGVLIGATISAIMLAIFTGNAGGAWDNAKKHIEAGNIEGEGKGSEAHKAAVVGDTVGDPLKDTVGPSLDICIKIMSVISLVSVSIFSQYNLISWISSLLKF